jgi:hypothetical protein
LAPTVEQVLALAPDRFSAAAARRLASQGSWKRLGTSDAAIWGECQGGALYQVSVARKDLSAECSCPSRKVPCKHALGLMLLSIEQEIPAAGEPEWVREWIDRLGRGDGSRKSRKSDPAAPPDPEAQARRAARRLERVHAGLDMLDRFLEDLARDGIASLEARPSGFFAQMAARLVDAQAPGLARRIRRIGFLAGGPPDWPRAVLEELGLLALASHAFRRIDELHAPLRADLRQLVGFSLEKDEVIAAGDRLEDTWLVAGQVLTEDERFRSQRSWLCGLRSGRRALVLQFAAGTARFAEELLPGSRIGATLAFWPSAFPQRALVQERKPEDTSIGARNPGFQSPAAFLDDAAGAFARQPFLERICCALRSVTPFSEKDRFAVRDQGGDLLPLAGREHWKLLALSGGRPLDVIGEWNGRSLFPLSAVAEGVFHSLRSEE